MDERKICSTCEQSRPVSDVNRSTKLKDGRQRRCRPCDREWYVLNAREHKRKVRLRNDRVREQWRQRLAAYLASHPCVDCAERDVRVLEFDHVDPRTEAGTIGRLMASSLPWCRIQAEIDECVVRCSNCHRIRTMTDCASWRVQAEQTRRADAAEDACERLERLLPSAS